MSAAQYEGLAAIGEALVAYGHALETVEPSLGPLYDPAVMPEHRAAFYPAAGDTRPDPTGAILLATSTSVEGLVGMKLMGTAA